MSRPWKRICAGSGAQLSGKQIYQSRFACAVGADDRVQLARDNTSKETSATALKPPKCLVSLRTCKIGSVIAVPRNAVSAVFMAAPGDIDEPADAVRQGEDDQRRSMRPSTIANAVRRRRTKQLKKTVLAK